MHLTLITGEATSRLVLPGKVAGQYWLELPTADGKAERLIGVEGLDGRWILKSGKKGAVVDDRGERLKDATLEPHRFYQIAIEPGESAIIHSEPTTEDRRRFRKYVLPQTEACLTIGRDQSAQIRFDSDFVSSRHAELLVGPSGVRITDTNSSNGTFVNGRRISSAELVPGDVVYIIGLMIIVGRGFIALNDPDGKVTCAARFLKPLAPQKIEPAGDEEIEEASAAEMFYRSPRFKTDIQRPDIRIDSPPQPVDAEDMPLIIVIGPAMTMGMAALFTGFFAVNSALSRDGNISAAMPTLVMSISMLGGTVLWPILSRRYQRRMKREREEKRRVKYLAYLESLRERLKQESQHQTEILRASLTTVDECIRRVEQRDRALWERMRSHNDFLRVRLGMGDWPLQVELKYAERRFMIDDDNLQDDMYELVESPLLLRNVPVSLSLVEQRVIGLIGPREYTAALLTNLIIQLAALHSYDDLKMVFIYNECEAAQWDFVRWLPHVWSDDKSVRFVVTNQADLRAVALQLERVLSRREAINQDEERESASPYYLVFALDRDLAGKSELMKRLLEQRKGCGFSVVALYDELRNLPKECRAVIEVDPTTSRLFDKDDITQRSQTFTPDPDLPVHPESLARVLGNTQLDSAESAFTLPSMITLLEMFGVGKVEHLNLLTRWKESNPVLSLAAPVGVGNDGEMFQLDIHEKYHGPHGLIAGMTGSGKSEFIMTYIISLAMNYHPDEVAFVLIDYKGGGMANAFADLPHVAGKITNLDGAAVNRSLISIQSELKRRQAVFNLAGERTGTSNIDIYKYQDLYRQGAVDEPLPHLLIISDEFAELKSQQPEFMAQLVSAARIGRSLGVHLILATQKPSGVVDDQIWSNSRFRVCLKVQEKADSMEVIKRPDAAELSTTGRFYLQVGFNELFEMGQSAWGGAQYYPSDRFEKSFDDSVTLIDNVGRVIDRKRRDRNRMTVKNPPKQLDEVTNYIIELAREEGVRARPLWLEPISGDIVLDEVVARYSHSAAPFVLDPVLGEYDDPATQQQGILTVPFFSEGNVAVFGSAGVGKTEFLTALVYSLISTHSAEELSVYLLDFASETLVAFKDAPQVGDVVVGHQAEKVENLFRMLNKELDRRRKLFADYGGDYAGYIRDSGEHIDSIVVAINNFAAFVEMYDDKEEAVSYLTREGTRYGIYFVLTAIGSSAIRFRILQNIKQQFVLQLNDPTEYSGILGSTGGVIPSAIKGRGIVRRGDVYEFQTARVAPVETGEAAHIREFCERLSADWEGPVARRIPILPTAVKPSYLADEIDRAGVGPAPVGIDKNSLEVAYRDFTETFITQVLSSANDSGPFLQGLAEAFGRVLGERVVVLDSASSFTEDPDRAYEYRSPREAPAAVEKLYEELVARNNAQADARTAGKQSPSFEAGRVLITSLTGLIGSLDAEQKDKFGAMLEKCDAALGITFVVAEAAGAMSSVSFESWARTHLNNNTGIWLGDGINDQFALQPAKSTPDMYQENGAKFGYLLDRGKARFVKLIEAESLAGAEDYSE